MFHPMLIESLGQLGITEPPPVCDWLIDQNIWIPSSVSPRDGDKALSFDKRPYMRAPLECFHPESGVRRLDLSWGAQTAKTFLVQLGVYYRLHNVPLPIIWGFPDEKAARWFSQDRFQSILDHKKNTRLASIKPVDGDDYTILVMRFRTAPMWVVTPTPSGLASKTAGIIVKSEAAKWTHERKDEAHPLLLIDKRANDLRDMALIVTETTPNTDTNESWLSFKASTMEEWQIPCPYCDHGFALELTRDVIQWSPDAKNKDGIWNEDKVRESAHYVCPSCHRPFDDATKLRQLPAGQWIVTNPNASRSHRGYHLESAASPNMSAGALAVEFLKSLQSLTGAHDVLNSFRALPYTEIGGRVEESDVRACCAAGDLSYRRGTIPRDATYLCVGADVGQNQTHWAIGAVMRDETIYILDWGTVLGVSGLRKSDLLRRLVDPEYVHRLCFPDGTPLDFAAIGTAGELGAQGIPFGARGLCDANYDTDRVFELCAASEGFWFPYRGSKAREGYWAEASVITHPGLVQYNVVDRTIKKELYLNRIGKLAAPRLYLPTDADNDLIHGLSGQEFMLKNGGYFKDVADDHFGDCVKEILASTWIMRAHISNNAADQATASAKPDSCDR